MWCDLGFVPNSRGNKAAANLRPSLSDPAPSAAAEETEDDDDAAPHEEDSSLDEDEQPPSKTSKGNGQAPAAKQRGPNRTRE